MLGDLHCHTKLSDGSLGLEELIMLAKNRGVETIAITDHDCLAGTVRGKIIGKRYGVNVIPGVEISAFDSERNRKVHMLAYLCDSPDRLEGLCKRISLARRRAGQYMTLRASKKYPITPEFVLKCATGSTNLYKQHIMRALMEAGFATEIYGDLYKSLFTPGGSNYIGLDIKYPDAKEVLEEIHEAGGIAVLAHCGAYNNYELLDELIELGLDGVEVWHPRHSEEDVQRLLKIADKHGLVRTGGSDFHGFYNDKPRSIGECGVDEEIIDELLSYKSKKKRQEKKAAAGE